MDLQAFRDEFRVLTQDVAKKRLWPDAEVDKWANDAEEEAAIRARLLFDTDELPVTAGDPLVALSPLLFDIQYAELRDDAGNVYELTGTSRFVLDRNSQGWRARTDRPGEYVHDEKKLILSALPDQDYTLYIEFFRIPKRRMKDGGDKPEIAALHHEGLLNWILHKAYSKQDADTLDTGKAKEAEGAFTRQFGRRPSSDMRRRQNANLPHRNTVHP